MSRSKALKTDKNHKFPHLQNEVDVILEAFDYESHGGGEGTIYNENIEFEKMDIEDVINGRIEKVYPRKRRSVVDISREDDARRALALEKSDSLEEIVREELSLLESDLHQVDEVVQKSPMLSASEKKKIHNAFSMLWKAIRF